MKIKNLVKSTIGAIKHYSPEIYLVLGIGTGIGALVMSCKKVKPVEDILTERKEAIANLEEDKPVEGEVGPTSVLQINANTGLKIAKEVIIPVALEACSIFCIYKSNKIKSSRLAEAGKTITTLTSLYASEQKNFKRYRKVVADKFGEDVDREILHGIAAEKTTDTVVDEETGKNVKVKKVVNVVNDDNDPGCDLTKFFDSSSRYWNPDPWENKQFLISKETYWTKKLIDNGIVVLADVLKSLDIEPTAASYFNIWVYDVEHPESHANKVSFGIWDSKNETVKRFLDGYEAVVCLDFNVDGPIWEEAMAKGLIAKH